MSEVSDGIHTSHCCHKHGCKYAVNSGVCPVENGTLKQEFPCEFCTLSHPEQDKTVDAIVAWLENRVKELRELTESLAPAYIRRAAGDRAHYYDDVIRGIKERAWKK